MEKYKKSIFIFRRDYRLRDNIGLMEALKTSKQVIPIFIFTPEQLVKNPYKSDNCVQFMMESLDDLDKDLKSKGSKIWYFYGKPHDVVKSIIKSDKDIEGLYVNLDFTPYSKKRDAEIEKVCEQEGVEFHSIEDLTMYPIGSIRTGNDEVYSKFTPYYNKTKKIKVPEPINNNYSNYYSNRNKIKGEFKGKKEKFYKENKNIAVHGGRDNALKILANIKNFKDYNQTRDCLNIPTTRLSAYIKFGCVSIREVYHKIKEKLGTKNELIKQLHWREFYYNVTDAYPNTLSDDWKKKNFKEQYSKVPWITVDKASTKQKEMFEKWKKGESGIPLIDASMREIRESGFMHNRGRLLVGNFLIKNMFFHWAEGEKYFSQMLCDLDIPNNTQNWLWLSSAGADSVPYFRTFNVWTQAERYDPNCEYIKKWVPELKDVENEHILKWYKYYDQYPDVDYPEPMLDVKETAKKSIAKYKKALYK